MFYLTTHSTHFIYGYMMLDMVKDHSDSEIGNLLLPHVLLFLSSRKILLYTPFHRQDSTYHSLCYTIRGHWLERDIVQCVHHEGSIWWSIAPWANVLTTELHLAPHLLDVSFQTVLHNWSIKGCGMFYPVCVMVHIKEPLLLIGKSSPCGGSRFPLSIFKWSYTICLMPYNHK